MDAAKSQITKLVVCYPGRFQPCGLHHATTFKMLKARFDGIGGDTYMVTSNKVELPKSPFNFDEKQSIINAHGIKEVVQVKSPYMASELLNRYDSETTAVLYAVGEKDMSVNPRFKAGLKKNGKPTYYQHYGGNENNLQPYTKHAYLVIAPHVDIQIPGIGEMSGTALRNVLSKAAEETFATIMGFTNKKIYDMIKSKLSGAANKFRKKNKKKTKKKKKHKKKTKRNKKTKRI